MATTVNYQCPHCSAPLSFIPGNKTVTCEYCGNEFEIAAIEKMFEEQQKMAAKELDVQRKPAVNGLKMKSKIFER